MDTYKSMFQQQLEYLVEKTDGGIAAFLVGFDGILVDHYTKTVGDLDVISFASECTYLMNQVHKSSELLHLGSLQEVSFHTNRWNILLQTMNTNYFLVLMMTKTGLVSKGRFFLDLTTLQLQREMKHELSNQS